MLNLYARELNAFDDAEVQLLQDLALDLSLGIVTLRARDERQQALAALENANQTVADPHCGNQRAAGSTAGPGHSRLADRSYNRRYLAEALNRELARAEREGQPVSLIMFDIDHFKRLNDTYGHQAGDRVLQALGNLIRSQTRPADIPFRYGGEEFLIILPNMPLPAAHARADQLRETCAALRVPLQATQLSVTVSIGVSVFPQDGVTPDDLTRMADNCLYEAKHSGRNKVVVGERVGA